MSQVSLSTSDVLGYSRSTAASPGFRLRGIGFEQGRCSRCCSWGGLIQAWHDNKELIDLGSIRTSAVVMYINRGLVQNEWYLLRCLFRFYRTDYPTPIDSRDSFDKEKKNWLDLTQHLEDPVEWIAGNPWQSTIAFLVNVATWLDRSTHCRYVWKMDQILVLQVNDLQMLTLSY